MPRGAFTIAAALLLGASFAGCSTEPTRETPSGALELFIEAMERSARDRGALEQAFELLSPKAQKALRKRAQLAGSLAGRDFEPWEMIAQGRFRLRFAPSRMQARVDGQRAVVVVEGSEPGQQAEVPMVADEQGGWRVDLPISAR